MCVREREREREREKREKLGKRNESTYHSIASHHEHHHWWFINVIKDTVWEPYYETYMNHCLMVRSESAYATRPCVFVSLTYIPLEQPEQMHFPFAFCRARRWDRTFSSLSSQCIMKVSYCTTTSISSNFFFSACVETSTREREKQRIKSLLPLVPSVTFYRLCESLCVYVYVTLICLLFHCNLSKCW